MQLYFMRKNWILSKGTVYHNQWYPDLSFGDMFCTKLSFIRHLHLRLNCSFSVLSCTAYYSVLCFYVLLVLSMHSELWDVVISFAALLYLPYILCPNIKFIFYYISLISAKILRVGSVRLRQGLAPNHDVHNTSYKRWSFFALTPAFPKLWFKLMLYFVIFCFI